MENSSIGRVVGALVSPVRTFQAIAERPTWLVALVVLVAIGLVSSVIVTQRIDPEEIVRSSLEQQGRDLDEDSIEQAVEFQERFGRLLILGGALVAQPVVYLVVALVFWVVFKLVGGDFSYKTGFSVTLHGLMPWAVASLLNIPVILGRAKLDFEELQGGGNLLASNLGVFAPEDAGAVLKTLLTSFELFTFWSLALLAIGYSIAGKTSRKTAAVTVIAVWAIYVVGKLGWVSIFS